MKPYIEFPVHYKPPSQEMLDEAKAFGEVVTTESEGWVVTISFYKGAFYVLDVSVVENNS
jgi:hypothetical protein